MGLYVANPGYCLFVRDEEVVWNGNNKRVIKPSLAIHFGEIGSAYAATDGNDTPVTQDGTIAGARVLTAESTSGLIDTDEMAEKLRWTKEDKDLVESELENACTNPYAPAYGDITRYEAPKVEPPWPSYDDQTVEKVIATATVTGLVSEARQYEALTKNRAEVMAALEKLLVQDEALVAE